MRAHLILGSLCSLLLTHFAHAQTMPSATTGITVSGECLTKVLNDRGGVTVGSTALAKTPQLASDQAVKQHEEIKQEVKRLNLKEATTETASYQVYQECSYADGKRRCEGFRAHIATRFETSEIARVGEVIALAAKLGSEEVSGLEIFASPAQVKSARESCLEIATKNAFDKAQKIAIGAGVKLGKVTAISEGSGGGDVSIPRPMASRRVEGFAMSEASAPSIDTKPLDLQVHITATYAIE